MNLIEILFALQELQTRRECWPESGNGKKIRAEMWALLEDMGVDYTLQTAIMKSIDENGNFINLDQDVFYIQLEKKNTKYLNLERPNLSLTQ